MFNKFNERWVNLAVNLIKPFSYGTFFILFGFYLSPIVKEAKYKNQCIMYSTKTALTQLKNDTILNNLLEETDLTIDEVAKIEGYKNCIN